MKFSRNPISGVLESYSDEAIFAGPVLTMADLIGDQKKTAQDGGPGSGNFGHAGRPGKVGGSTKGGGNQYRGGRADIGYFNSRKDWLNGLSGEKQAEASKFIESHRAIMKESQKVKERLDDLYKRGMLTSTEVEERLKKEGLEKLRDDMTPEEYIMKCGSTTDKNNLTYHVGEARNWKEYKDRLIKENLDEDEQKTINWILENVRDFNEYPASVDSTYSDLKAKALGLPNSGDPIPDEVLYMSGAKERPTTNSRLNWYSRAMDRTSISRMMESNMMDVVGGERPQGDYYLHRLTKEGFEDLTQKFLDTLKYKELDKDTLMYARLAISDMKNASDFKDDQNYGNMLSDEELEQIKKARDMTETLKIKRMARRGFLLKEEAEERIKLAKEKPIDRSEITGSMLYDLQRDMSFLNPTSKEDKHTAQDFLIVEAKLMTGMEPKNESESEVLKEINLKKAQEKAEKAEAKKKAKERVKRDEQLWKEEEERRAKGISENNPMAGYTRNTEKLNRDHMTEVIDGCNPYYSSSVGKKDKRYYHNCQRCVMAFVARLRGYEVEAKPRLFPHGNNSEDRQDPIFKNGGLQKIFYGASQDHVPGRTAEEQRNKIEKDLTDGGDGALGLVSVLWKGERSGHIYVVMNDKGVIKYIDPQDPKADASKYIAPNKIEPWYTKIIRVDEKPFTHWIHQAVRPEGGQYDDNFKDDEHYK